MEATNCHPPFCKPGCSIQHDKLLLALVNCPDDYITAEYELTLQKLIGEKQKRRQPVWTLSSPIDDPNPDFRYPVILWACALGKPKLVQWLLENGFESSTQDIETGDNGLHRSVVCLQNSCGDLKKAVSTFLDLLQLIEDCIMVQNDMGWTPLHNICHMYTEKKPVPEFFYKCATSVVEYAASKGQDFATRLVNTQTKKGDTVLHILAREDSTARLLKTIVTVTKPDPRLKDIQGITALGIAVNAGHMKICQFLSKYMNTSYDDELKNQPSLSETGNQSNLRKTGNQSKLDQLNEFLGNMLGDQSLLTDEAQNEGARKSPRKNESTTFHAGQSQKSPKQSGITNITTSKSIGNAELSGVGKTIDSRKSPRRGTKRKLDENKETGEDTSENEKTGNISEQEEVTNVFEFSKNLKKKLKTDKDKNNNDNSVKQNTDSVKQNNDSIKQDAIIVNQEFTTAQDNVGADSKESSGVVRLLQRQASGMETRFTGKPIKTEQIYSPSERQSRSVTKSRRQSVTRSRSCSIGSKAVKQNMEKDSEHPPNLSPHLPGERDGVNIKMDDNPLVLSPSSSVNILKKAKHLAENEREAKAKQLTINKTVWSRYIKDCMISLTDSLPMIMKMSPPQIEDMLLVNPAMREKLCVYLEALELDELNEIPEAVREVILNDPAEEILKNLIAEDVKENREREKRFKGIAGLDLEQNVNANSIARSGSAMETANLDAAEKVPMVISNTVGREKVGRETALTEETGKILYDMTSSKDIYAESNMEICEVMASSEETCKVSKDMVIKRTASKDSNMEVCEESALNEGNGTVIGQVNEIIREKAGPVEEEQSDIGMTCVIVNKETCLSKEIAKVEDDIGVATNKKAVDLEETGAINENNVVGNEDAGVERNKTGAVNESNAGVERNKTGAINENSAAVNEDAGVERNKTGAINENNAAVNEDAGVKGNKTGAVNENNAAVNKDAGVERNKTGAINENNAAVNEDAGVERNKTGAVNENNAAVSEDAGVDGNGATTDRNDNEKCVSLDYDKTVPLNVSPSLPKINDDCENTYTIPSPMASPSTSTSISCCPRDSSVETDTESRISEILDSSCSESEMVSSTSVKRTRHKRLDRTGGGLKEYLSLSSTKDGLRQMLVRDKLKCEERKRKRIEYITEITNKEKELEKVTAEIDAEIEETETKLQETETKLQRLKQKKDAKQKQTENFRTKKEIESAAVQDDVSKLQTLDKALEELDDS